MRDNVATTNHDLPWLKTIVEEPGIEQAMLPEGIVGGVAIYQRNVLIYDDESFHYTALPRHHAGMQETIRYLSRAHEGGISRGWVTEVNEGVPNVSRAHSIKDSALLKLWHIADIGREARAVVCEVTVVGREDVVWRMDIAYKLKKRVVRCLIEPCFFEVVEVCPAIVWGTTLLVSGRRHKISDPGTSRTVSVRLLQRVQKRFKPLEIRSLGGVH